MIDIGMSGGQRSLRPRARLMLMLGVELISSEAVAVSELVKNSYDADASTVIVSLVDETLDHPARLMVMDDGSGMSVDTVLRTWLEPATPSRRRRKISETGRRSLGEKGIGRFATAKLAHRLELATYNGNPAEGEVQLAINWDDFSDENRYLDEIDIPWSASRPTFFGDTSQAADIWRSRLSNYLKSPQGRRGEFPDPGRGTVLWMDELRTSWSESFVQDIARTLSRLISPAADELLERSERDFRILLDLPSRFGTQGGWLGPSEELSRPHYRLRAEVDAEGRAHINMRIRGEGESRPPIDTQFSGKAHDVPRCGPFSLNLHVWDRDQAALSEIAPNTKVADFRNLLNEAAGVSVYRDGFRVLPYGEMGDDWLQLDRRRINDPTRGLSNNQIVGVVSITADDNPELVDQTNREGLVEGPALDDLRKLIKEIMRLLEQARYTLRHEDEQYRPRPNAQDLFQPFRLKELREAATSRSDTELIELVNDAEAQIEEQNTQIREIVARYQRLATLGQLIDQMVHEVAQPVVAAREAAVAGLEVIEDDQTVWSERGRNLIGQLQTEFRVIRDQSHVVADVLGRLAPFGGRKRGRPRSITVESAMRNVCQIMQHEIRARKADVTIPDSRTYVTVDGTEMQEILLNLLQNSLYWITRTSRGHARQISFDLEREDDKSLSVFVSDTGPGVPEEDRPYIFSPYFTKREGGVGLGLSIAGQIVEDYYGGSLVLISPGFLGGATFRANLTRRVSP
jgi:signal transduction histidine kinase